MEIRDTGHNSIPFLRRYEDLVTQLLSLRQQRAVLTSADSPWKDAFVLLVCQSGLVPLCRGSCQGSPTPSFQHSEQVLLVSSADSVHRKEVPWPLDSQLCSQNGGWWGHGFSTASFTATSFGSFPHFPPWVPTLGETFSSLLKTAEVTYARDESPLVRFQAWLLHPSLLHSCTVLWLGLPYSDYSL